jgi:hypothetical protein
MSQSLPWLKISDNKRYLVQEDGTPFFWLGDTAWELFHKLDREEAQFYLSNRAKQKFNVIQAVALAELEGLTTDNAYGRRPLKLNDNGKYDPTLPDLEGEYSYWDHVDYIVDTAAALGLYIAFLPTWGDKYHLAWGKGPEIFDHSNAVEYGQWLGNRYKDRSNIIWVLGGDRALMISDHYSVIRGMAEGLQAGDSGSHLTTFHPMGEQSSSHYVHTEPWLAFNMLQSGHGLKESDNYLRITEDYNRLPVKPTIDAEPCYEDHPRGFNADNGYFDEADVRKAAYHAVFAGAFGHTYGHHSIWSLTTDPLDYFIMHWKDAIQRPGAHQMQHVRSLMESRSFLDRIPDQSLIAVNYAGSNYMVATRGESYAMIYCPNGLKVKIIMGIIKGDKVKASWYDPRVGLIRSAGEWENTGEISYTPPSSGRGNDWVLLLDGSEFS